MSNLALIVVPSAEVQLQRKDPERKSREPLNNDAWSAFQSEKPQIVWCDASDSSRRYGRAAQRPERTNGGFA
ncbi:MAG: hypothetical protein ACXIUM_15450, partial [Wenzhouxiangella sp.]